MTSWAMAPPIGGRNPDAAANMPRTLRPIPPTALSSAIERIRRPIWMSSSTFPEGRLEDHRVRRFAGDIAVQPEGQADGGGLHGGGVVDSVPDKNGFCLFGFFPNNRDFLFWALSGMHLTDAHRPGQISDFGRRSPETSNTRFT